jgi:flavorubredoxin
MKSITLFLMTKLAGLNMQLNLIAPDHGPIWRRDIDHILKQYAAWANPKRTAKALIVYDTMWHSTEKMARAIAEGLLSGGAKPKIMPLGVFHDSDIVTELLDSGALIVGSPTFNSGLLPTVAGFLSYAKGLKIRHVLGAAFGSYGWNPGSVKLINETLTSMRIELAGEGISAKYVPDQAALDQCFKLGEQVADKLKVN